MWSKVLFVSCSLFVLGLVQGKPKFINFGTFVCPREVNGLAKCLKDNLNMYIPRLGRGVPEYKIPSCEPLIIPEVTFQQARGPVMVESQYSDIAVYGPSAMKIRNIDIDPANHRIAAHLFIPVLRIKGRYNIKGQILMLPIEGEGMCTGNYSDIDATADISLGRAPRPNGRDALTCEDLGISFKMGKAEVQMENLFGGDERMGNMMNRFLNDNWSKVSSELQPALEQSLRDFLKPLADRAFSTLNADDILSGSEN